MTKYTITIHNKSSKVQEFILYGTTPGSDSTSTSDAAPDGVTFWFPCMAHQSVPSGQGAAKFQFDYTMYGVCGTEKLENDVQVSESDRTPEPIDLGSDGKPPRPGTTLQISYDKGMVSFDDPEPTPSANAGSFQVHTKGDFVYKDNVWVGYATKVPGSADQMSITAVANVGPSTMYTFTPHIRFRVSTGSYDLGTIVDIKAVGDPLVVDFQHGHTAVSATYDEHGKYIDVVYS